MISSLAASFLPLAPPTEAMQSGDRVSMPVALSAVLEAMQVAIDATMREGDLAQAQELGAMAARVVEILEERAGDEG